MRTRLTALILVPTAVGVLLAGARVAASVEGVAVQQRTASAAEYSGRLRDLAQALGLERDRGAWAAFQPANKGLESSFTSQKRGVDELLQQVRADLRAIDDSYGPRAVKAARDAMYQFESLGKTRDLPGTARAERYVFLINPLLQLHEELTLVSEDPEIIGNTRGLSALAYAKEEVSRQRARLLAGYYAPALINAQQVEEFIASRSRLEERKAEFAIEAGAENGQLLSTQLVDERVHRAELTKSKAIALAGKPDASGRLLRDLTEVKQWFGDNTEVLNRIRKVETKVAGDVITRARELEDAEQRAAIIAAGLILTLLLLVLGLTVLIARSMVLPLRRLRVEALDVAGHRLPDVVRRLRISGETQTPEVEPISVDSRDEIGEVAKAFDEVHRQAVRLAAEESELRSNISAMFVNLSRRTQTLVERQISLIDGLEKGEQDGGRLGDLFKLDHLATRMRRNSENLLVLAGHEPTRRRSQPAKLVDVVRASLSEVEDYERVQIKVHRAISVAGSAANDIVHLVAELVENAIQFSPRASQVVVSSSMIEGGGALLAVSDAGIGMTADELVETNRRLADPPVVDVSVSRRMGLFVVGRLALRHGIRVQLRPQETGGLIAMVLFPPELVVEATSPVPGSSWGSESLTSQSSFGQASLTANPFSQAALSQGSFGQASMDQSADRGQAPAGRNPFGQIPGQGSYGQASMDRSAGGSFGQGPADPPADRGPFGQGSFGQTSLDQGSFGRPAAPQAPSFGSADQPLPERRPAQAAPFGAPPQSAEAPLPKRQVGASNGNGASAGGGDGAASAFSAWGQASHDDPVTASMPAVGVSPLEPEQEEFLPIFASVESAWFRRVDGPAETETAEEPGDAGDAGYPDAAEPVEAVPPVRERAPEPAPEPVPAPVREAVPASVQGPATAPLRRTIPARQPENWQTPADAGWQAAQAASDPSLGGITAAGLPKRTPKANLVPGAAASAPSTPMPPISPERVRNRLSSFQQGVRRGRAELYEDTAQNGAEKEEGQ
ncbi:nitrate- and nitrite sensing domain-containing protein [Planomonospora sp. ID82291]|uniref:nitrate- and nitrite sensing domain-containing protein n=1 Tax=Planomonospora sp. ID82291 TaxID=2738136 RepID=UPI0018C3A295|nr:nitrate- and nitrite sensing domain-containing protein [Planomonospora sp. ID82291]MBG0812921.1 nitrate- and nitrite sensing domain-containing protein [Planomonospora sp. ID82291]